VASSVRSLNLGLRFALELGLLGALGWWGFSHSVALGILAPVAAAVVWGLFVAPKARFPVPLKVRAPLEIAIFALAVLALWAVGQPVLAIVFASAVALSEALLYGLG
jgi:hypothetical protein